MEYYAFLRSPSTKGFEMPVRTGTDGDGGQDQGRTGTSAPTVETRSKAPRAASGSVDCDAEYQVMTIVEPIRATWN